MAANYWESTQRRCWQFTKQELADVRQKLEAEDPALVSAYPLAQLRHLSMYYNQQISRLGKRLQIRQQVLSTAQLYLRRFYTKVEIRRTNPYLVLATAVYLASKMEESPQHIRVVVTEARSLWPDFFITDASKLGECEFFLISEMNSQLIVHHPYRTLLSLQDTFKLTTEESTLAWSIINDHYMTDLPLLYPPHVIAITAILLALVLRPLGNGATAGGLIQAGNVATAAQSALTGGVKGTNTVDRAGGAGKSKLRIFSEWLADTEVDIEGMIDCTQELISFYEVQEQYDEKKTKEQINRYVKARGLER